MKTPGTNPHSPSPPVVTTSSLYALCHTRPFVQGSLWKVPSPPPPVGVREVRASTCTWPPTAPAKGKCRELTCCPSQSTLAFQSQSLCLPSFRELLENQLPGVILKAPDRAQTRPNLEPPTSLLHLALSHHSCHRLNLGVWGRGAGVARVT